MRAYIVITDEKGNSFEGTAGLVPIGPNSKTKKKASTPKTLSAQSIGLRNLAITFSLPMRAFIKKHVRGLGGPQKFALMLAYLSKGEPNKTQVSSADIQKHWNKMTTLLGKFNAVHALRAKEHGWVDSPKQGTYVLQPTWKGIWVGE